MSYILLALLCSPLFAPCPNCDCGATTLIIHDPLSGTRYDWDPCTVCDLQRCKYTVPERVAAEPRGRL